MALYYVSENVVNMYEVEASSVEEAIDKAQVSRYDPIEIDTVEWSAELVYPEVESETPEAICARLEAKLDSILARLNGAGK